MTTMTMGRVRPAGIAERAAAAIGVGALRWAHRRAAARTRDAAAVHTEHLQAIERRERDWARLESIRLR